MTDFAKWDRIAAELSDEEEEDAESLERKAALAAARPGEQLDRAGLGNDLGEDGRCLGQNNRPGNARGNALSTNKSAEKVVDISGYTWEQTGAEAVVTVPLKPLGAVTREKVALTFRDDLFELRVLNEMAQTFRLRVPNLPDGGIVPAECRYRVDGSPDTVVITLAKARPGAKWAALGKQAVRKDLVMKTISDYAWVDEPTHVKVYLKLPGVHKVPKQNIVSRFRELSLDCTVYDLNGNNWQFAITELPMEVVVKDSYHQVRENELKLYIKKHVRTSWFKLQLHR